MCEPVTLMLMAAGAQMAGQVMQGQQQQEMANAQAQQALNEGAYRADAAKAQAEKIRRAGKAQSGEAKAALAASGVKLGEGTALEVQKSITQGAEEDALSALLSGKRAQSAAQEEASMLGQAGENAVTNSYFAAAGTALSAGGTYARGGWKSTAKAGG